MKWILVFSTFLLIAICNSCGNPGQKSDSDTSLTATDTPKTATSAHNSMNSLDWGGVYQGKLPCGDCEGVAVELLLQNDLTYSSTSKYMGKATPALLEKGTFTWDASGNNIMLHPEKGSPTQYEVAENKLFQLDAAGQKFTGATAEKFVLIKTGDARMAAQLGHGDAQLKETYWKLAELDGKQAPPVKNGRPEIYMILKEKDSVVTGFAGCNALTGKYVVKEGNRIAFSGIVSTLMTCLNQRGEDDFKKALRDADNFSIKGDTLSLNKGKTAPLARFAAVYRR